LRAYESGPPPLFNQGVSARARLAFFSFLAIALIVIDSRIRALETVRVGVGVVLYPIQQVLLVPSRAFDAVADYFGSVSALQQENARLKEREVANAQALQQAQDLATENDRLRRLLAARERLPNASLLAAVLYETRDRFSRKIVLHAGSNEGVRPASPVIDELGVVGQVTRVFRDTCEVTLLTDKDQAIPVQIQRNGLRGVAYGGAQPGTLDLRFMASNADVMQGDVATTSGLDGVYPPGLAVARIEHVERATTDQFARIVMRPLAGVENHRQLLILLTEPVKLPPATGAPSESASRKGGRR
jgi:rod shape-determining protein MreC